MSSTAEPAHAVDAATIAATLPSGTAYAAAAAGARQHTVTDIREHLYDAVSKMVGLGSFIYIETQFFIHLEFVSRLCGRWLDNLRAHGGEPTEGFPPFAYVLVPYKPDPPVDVGTNGDWVASVPEWEMSTLKWLEVMTARKFMERDGGVWKFSLGVDDPTTQVKFWDAGSRRVISQGPGGLGPATHVRISRGHRLDEYGDPVVPRTIVTEKIFRLDEFLTVSDIMAFTLTATHKRDGSLHGTGLNEIDPNDFGSDPEEREADFLEENHIYVHAKCAFFLGSRESGDPPVCVGTIGSANFNGRSLGDELDPTDEPDTELNVFFRGDSVVAAKDRLWEHHAGRAVGAARFHEMALENLRRVQRGQRGLEGHVVRLDVVQRYKDL